MPSRMTHKEGFNIIELMFTVFILSILAFIYVPRYLIVLEKGRSAEARRALGVIRDMELQFFVENNAYTNSMANLFLNYPAACAATNYFSYGLATAGGGSTFTATATRCTAGGKTPQGSVAFVLNMTQAGDLGGTAAYL